MWRSSVCASVAKEAGQEVKQTTHVSISFAEALIHTICVSCAKAALAADDDEAQPSGRDFDDTASEASSAVSGMSAYGGSTTTGASSVAGSSARPASTVGGKKPHKRKQKKV